MDSRGSSVVESSPYPPRVGLVRAQAGKGCMSPPELASVCVLRRSVKPTLRPRRLQPARLLCPWNFPGKILEWAAISFFRGSSPPRDRTHISLSLLHWKADSLPLCCLTLARGQAKPKSLGPVITGPVYSSSSPPSRSHRPPSWEFPRFKGRSLTQLS